MFLAVLPYAAITTNFKNVYTKEKWFPFSEFYSGYYQYAILPDQWMVNGNSTWKRNNENIHKQNYYNENII